MYYTKATNIQGGPLPLIQHSTIKGDEVTILGNSGALVRSGYTFSGWNTEADGTGLSYEAGDTFTIDSEHVTLYAVWTPEVLITSVAAGSGYSYILKNDGTLWGNRD